MSTLKTLVCAGLVGAGTIAAAPDRADAGGFSISIGRSYGYPSYGYSSHRYGRPAGLGHLSHYGLYGGYGGRHFDDHHGHSHRHSSRVWHDTSHWDYYPGRLVPHGDHYDYIPGHRVWHNDGHWDRIDHGHGHHHHH